jgi:hypothetical protein
VPDLKLLCFDNRKPPTDGEVLARVAEAMRRSLSADVSNRVAALGACLDRQDRLLSSADFFNKDVVMYYLSIARTLCERIQTDLEGPDPGEMPPAA